MAKIYYKYSVFVGDFLFFILSSYMRPLKQTKLAMFSALRIKRVPFFTLFSVYLHVCLCFFTYPGTQWAQCTVVYQ